MSRVPLPKPVLDPAKRPKVQVDPDHGLWGFFNEDKKLLTRPKDEAAHGIINRAETKARSRLIEAYHRPRLVLPRITTQILGRPTLTVVAVLQGT